MTRYDCREQCGLNKDPVAIRCGNKRSLLLGVTVLFSKHITNSFTINPTKAATEKVISEQNALAKLYHEMDTDVIKFKVGALTSYYKKTKTETEKKKIWNGWVKQAKAMVKDLEECSK